MLDKKEFLQKYRISEQDFEEAKISWEELTAIYENYQSMETTLREIGKDFVDEYLYDIQKAGIHSYRYRTKEPGHLLEKIIRKRRENFQKFDRIDRWNFHKYFTDLIGIRVFFLYREDWIHFNISRRCLKMILPSMWKIVWKILMRMRITIILQSGQKCISGRETVEFTMIS